MMLNQGLSVTELSDDNHYYTSPNGGYTVYSGNSNPYSVLSPKPAMDSRPYTSNALYPKAEQMYPMGRQASIPPKARTNPKTEHGIRHLMSVYAEKCSLNGIIFIKSTKYVIVRIIWTILLLGALGMMFYHLYRLGKNYYSYEKQSKLDLKFEKLRFPAVTICNVNAIRKSELYRASENLQELVEMVNPSNLEDEADSWEPAYEDYSGDYYGTDDEKRRKRSTSSSTTVKHRKSGFFDDFNFTDHDDSHRTEYSGDLYKDSWEAESEPAAFDQVTEQFTSLYSEENTTTRALMGHQIQELLVQCSFAGRKCFQSNFTLVSTTTLGNCFNLEYNKFISRQSGPRYGLSLILYLENHEYIPGITNSKGVKVVIHEPNTLPFPDDEGFAVSAGSQAYVGLRRVAISRLGNPWGNCTEIDSFKRQYGVTYTRQTCQEVCQMELILKACDCYDSTKPSIYNLFQNRGQACQSTSEKVYCMEDIQWEFDSQSCGCDSPCSEVQYRKTISTLSWPNPSFASLIAKTICREKGSLCVNGTIDEVELRENFVQVTIYFETLNYETLSEEPDYSEFQFISDIGGTVGLYVGLSVLSMCEIIHLLIAIFNHLLFRNANNN